MVNTELLREESSMLSDVDALRAIYLVMTVEQLNEVYNEQRFRLTELAVKGKILNSAEREEHDSLRTNITITADILYPASSEDAELSEINLGAIFKQKHGELATLEQRGSHDYDKRQKGKELQVDLDAIGELILNRLSV